MSVKLKQVFSGKRLDEIHALYETAFPAGEKKPFSMIVSGQGTGLVEILSLEELEAIAVCAADLGIRKIKVTGGEPLVRKGVDQLVAGLKAIPGIRKVTLTTNGILLARHSVRDIKA